MLTGRPPCRGETQEETLAQVLNVPPIPPRFINPQAPADLEAVCMKCLEKDPSRRYDSAKELAGEMQRFLNGEPVLARPVSNWRVRRHAAMAAWKIRSRAWASSPA
jgi:serine/threonine protein kinase